MSLLQRSQQVASRPYKTERGAVAPRTRVVAKFLHGLLQRQDNVCTSEQNASQQLLAERYEAMLQRAEQCTFHPPTGQLLGRAGRRATLEDGERLLDWCIQERPCDLHARVLQLRNLMIQGLGREREVPSLAIQALQDSSVSGCEFMSGCYFQVLQIVLLGLKALHKLAVEGAAVPRDPRYTSYTIPTFLAAAQQAVPGMAYDLKSLMERLQRQMCSYSPEQRRRLLFDHGYISCVDLQFVSGEHHAMAAVVGGTARAGGGSGVMHRAREVQQARW